MKLGQKLKKPCSSAKLILQEIIGLTTKNANGLSSVSCSSKCVYLAGCVVVVYDVDSYTQSHLVVSHRMPKPLSCVAVSQNGRFVAAGESQNLSTVLIWDCETLGLVSELKGHLYGAQCLSFSPNGEYLVSVGGYIYLWDWRKSVLVTKVKASSSCSEITSVAFSSNAKFIVTSGNKHLKYWTMGFEKKSRSSKLGSLAFQGKPTDHSFQKGNSFVSVVSTIKVNSSGTEERADEAMSIYALTDAGVLLLMSCEMLIKKSVNLKFSARDKLVVIYRDRSLYIWDVNDVHKPTRCSMMISHSAGIWDIKNLSCGNMHSPTAACVARGCCEGVSFTTCSEDGTIRLLDLALQLDPLEANASSNSSESKTQGAMHLASAGIFERDLVETSGTTFSFRALAVSEDGKYLAAGDCGGNLHIYDLQESEYTCFTDAHDAEIRSLSFSFPGEKDVDSENALSSDFLLASGGKGREIHIYDVKRNFDLVGSVRGSADVKSVKFASNGRKCLTSGADRDRSLYIWDVNDVHKPTRCSMMISHSAGIWDIKNLSCGNMHSPTAACVARGCCEGVSFTTCSEDGTIRLLDLALQLDPLEANASSNSSESKTQGAMHLASAGIFERDLVETSGTTFSFRALAVSEDGKYLAAGDCGGNLHIYDLQESEYTCFTDAHDAEIRSLSFSFPGEKDVDSENALSSDFLLASGGKGREIHIYDVKRNFDLVGSVRGSADVKSVKFASNGRKCLTSGADRLHLFDVVRKAGSVSLSPSQPQTLSHESIYEMAVDPTSGLVVTVGRDKKINMFDIESGKLVRSFKQDRDHGDPIKVILDPSCSYLACSYSDRTICFLDFMTGELVAQATGHGEAVTGVIFLPDCKHIISVAGDGCILVWKLPLRMATRMIRTVNENGRLAPETVSQPVKFVPIVVDLEEENVQDASCCSQYKLKEENADQMLQRSPWTSSFKFSASRLPKWAQAKVETFGIATACKDSISNQKHEVLGNAVVSAEECSSMNLECQTPIQGSRTEKSCLRGLSQSSNNTENSQGDTPSHRKETRWNTIYNVCFDFLNSPNIQRSFVKQQKPEFFCTKGSAEHGDMLKLFDNSFSMKEEVDAGKTSQQRRYSTQFVLRRDYIGGTKQFLRTPSQKSGFKALRTIQEQLPLDTVNDQPSQSSEHPKQDKTTAEEFHESLADDSLQERITSCHQALLTLNAAASVFVQSMSELSTVSPRDRISSELKAKLFDEAALMIPEMSQKVNEVIAKMMLEHKSKTQVMDNLPLISSNQ